MNRRDFLVRSGAALGTAALAAARRGHAASLAAAPPLTDWAAVRAEFDADPSYAHFAGFLLASHPRPVREAIARYRAELDTNPHLTLEERFFERDAAVVAAAASYLNVDAADIALTDSTTMGLGLVYTGLDLQAGDEILTSDHDHYSTHTAIDFGVLRNGAQIVRAPLYQDSRAVSVGEIVASIANRLTTRTRVVALTWVHSKTGLRLPVRDIADALAAWNAGLPPEERVLLCIDGVHGLGAVPGDPLDLGCDVFVAGTHKWIFGPRGTGIVWATPAAWGRIAPTIPPFGPQALPGTLHTPGGFHSFEHRWALDEGFRFHEQIGKARVYDRVFELNAPIREELERMPHVTLRTPLDGQLTSGIVCFEVAGMSPQKVVARLREHRILASVSPYSPAYARLAAGLLNDLDEVERALAAVRSLA